MNSDSLNRAVAALQRGGIIAYPTETVYGLGCDPRNQLAVSKIFRLKGRDQKKPVLLIASSISQVKKVARLSPGQEDFVQRYWPGSVTFVLPARRTLAKGITKDGTIAIRVSSSPIARLLARRLGVPIVSTSANRSGEPEYRSGKLLTKDFGLALAYVVDIGILPKQRPSTIAELRPDGTVVIYRRGKARLPKHWR